jgi:DNA polymerase III epsilon subunit-like protein
LHLYINHGISIPPEATAIHGYTTQFIEEVGIDPRVAHKSLEQYSKSAPICSHNLGYDWCRCILPERRRLNLHPKLQKGFCTLQLFRRTLDYQENYKLTHLKDIYNIQHPKDCPSHSAKGDVLTVLEIFQKQVFPILERHNITSLQAIKSLSKETPISRCRETLGLSAPYLDSDTNKPLEQIILETLADSLDLTEIEDENIKALDIWLSKSKKISKDKEQNKTRTLRERVGKIVSEGIIDTDERIELLEMIQPLLPLKTQATKKQLKYLKTLGVQKTEGLTKEEASKLIDKHKVIKKYPKVFQDGIER